MSQPMRAIVIWQPWASLVVRGFKRYETRSYPCSYRGDLAIIAGRSLEGVAMMQDDPIGHEMRDLLGVMSLGDLPRGGVVGYARLSGVIATDAGEHLQVDERECRFGNWGPDRFGWEMQAARVLRAPIAIRGQQGMFTLPESICDQIRAAAA